MHDLIPGTLGPTLPVCATCNGDSVLWSGGSWPTGPCPDCETGTDPYTVAAIRVALASTTKGPWSEEIEHCDCGDGYGCSHEPGLYSIHLPDVPSFLPPTGEVNAESDPFWLSRCHHSELATMPLDTALFLVRSRRYVEVLLAEIDRLSATNDTTEGGDR